MCNISREELRVLLELHVDLENSKPEFSLRDMFRHIRCGFRSNIPICCILFYVFVWNFIYLFMYFEVVKKFICWYPPKNVCEYVACPICVILRRRQELHECSEFDPNCCLNCRKV